jgi:hypothetical protein
MKLHPLIMAVLLFSPAIAAHCRHGRTLSRITKIRSAITKSLSASTKKPASVAGFRYLRLCITRLSAPFLPSDPTFPPPSGPQPDYSIPK